MIAGNDDAEAMRVKWVKQGGWGEFQDARDQNSA